MRWPLDMILTSYAVNLLMRPLFRQYEDSLNQRWKPPCSHIGRNWNEIDFQQVMAFSDVLFHFNVIVSSKLERQNAKPTQHFRHTWIIQTAKSLRNNRSTSLRFRQTSRQELMSHNHGSDFSFRATKIPDLFFFQMSHSLKPTCPQIVPPFF